VGGGSYRTKISEEAQKRGEAVSTGGKGGKADLVLTPHGKQKPSRGEEKGTLE